jgi:small-conductance mechanosensitive channel
LFFVKNPGHYLGPVWATFAGLSFSLQGPVKSFADACVFVFSQHPYDVGDWVIWGKEKDLKLIVDEIHLLKTAFTCADSGKTVHIPHTEICTGYIENLSRTSAYFVKSIVLHSEDKVDKCHKEAIRKFQQEELRDLWQNDEKREIFRYYQLPEISVVPINSEDLEEKGIRVDFKRKEWVCSSPIIRCSILLTNCSGSWSILQT